MSLAVFLSFVVCVVAFLLWEVCTTRWHWPGAPVWEVGWGGSRSSPPLEVPLFASPVASGPAWRPEPGAPAGPRECPRGREEVVRVPGGFWGAGTVRVSALANGYTGCLPCNNSFITLRFVPFSCMCVILK